MKGDASVEKRNFEANPHLKQVCDKRYPPVLFHKKEVTEGSRGVVGDDLSKAILSTNNRIVGVVINAIDDRLEQRPTDPGRLDDQSDQSPGRRCSSWPETRGGW